MSDFVCFIVDYRKDLKICGSADVSMLRGYAGGRLISLALIQGEGHTAVKDHENMFCGYRLCLLFNS